jgi:energy-converting hydrogenase Eha subunit E
MSGQLEPFQDLTPENRGPIVVVISFCLIAITIYVAGVRFFLAYNHKLAFQLDDASFVAATVRTALDLT